MTAAVFDSCILIDILRGVEQAGTILPIYSQRFISIITWIELMAGEQDEHQKEMISLVLQSLEVIPLDNEIAYEAAILRRDRKLKLPDAIILATARRKNLPLLTRNTKDFPEDMSGIIVPYRI